MALDCTRSVPSFEFVAHATRQRTMTFSMSLNVARSGEMNRVARGCLISAQGALRSRTHSALYEHALVSGIHRRDVIPIEFAAHNQIHGMPHANE